MSESMKTEKKEYYVAVPLEQVDAARSRDVIRAEDGILRAGEHGIEAGEDILDAVMRQEAPHLPAHSTRRDRADGCPT